MEQVVTIGLDIAKSVFQLHGIDAAGVAVAQPSTEVSDAGVFRAAGAVPNWASKRAALRIIEAIAPDRRHQAKLRPSARRDLTGLILGPNKCIIASARSTEVDRRLMGIPGVGPVLASALVATIADPKSFSSGRNLAAWIGLVPRQNSGGGKERLSGTTSKVIATFDDCWSWAGSRTPKVAAVALANKNARMAWAIMTSGERYREPLVA